MHPTGPVKPGPPLPAAQSAPARTLPPLRIGQVLAARVAGTPQPGQAQLRIGQQLLQAQTGGLKLSPGDTLKLEVTQLGRVPVLRIVDQIRTSTITQAIRQTLPRQQALPQVLSRLAQALGGSQFRHLPPQVQQRLQAVFNRLPDPARISTPQGLKQSLADSGTFLEAKLSSPASAPAGHSNSIRHDLKANLMRLVQALRQPAAAQTSTPGNAARSPAGSPSGQTQAGPATTSLTPSNPPASTPGAVPRTPDVALIMRPGMPPRPQPPVSLRPVPGPGEIRLPELLAQAESAVARIKLHQLASAPSAERPQLAEWLIDLPVRRNQEMLDLWSLRIERDSRQRQQDGESAEPRWNVTLAFDLPGLGPMQSRVTLQGRHQLTAVFMSETRGVLPLVNDHLPLLKARLEQAGLQVDSLACHHGRLPEPARRPNTPDGIVDEKA